METTIVNPLLSHSIFISLSRELKLPVRHNLFSKGLENTFCHQVIDALVSSHSRRGPSRFLSTGLMVRPTDQGSDVIMAP